MPTIYRTLLAKGYLPKELPPHFYSDPFAAYATTKAGRRALDEHNGYKPAANCTQCATYELSLAGGDRRVLSLPHPVSFARLCQEVAASFPRLLRKAGASTCSRSRPSYGTQGQRAMRTLVKPSNINRDRAVVRAGGRYLLKVDISQFYPSLYTHAVGWAIDPKARLKANWTNRKLLGKRIDQHLMNLQGKVSQGIPTGNDVSFLLAEVVLGQIDHALKIPPGRAVRWFDDYEIACDSYEEAEQWLAKLQGAMARFRLRVNPTKTKIVALPDLASDGWQTELAEASRRLSAKGSRGSGQKS